MIRLLVDSTSDYLLEEIEERNMIMVPLNVNFGEESWLDAVEMKKDEFYDRLLHGSVLPKTSLPAPASFLEHFLQAKEKGEELICILLSSAISGTWQSAVTAKEMADYDGIYIIDSKSTTACVRVMGDYAAKLIAEGLSAKEIVEKVEALKGRVKVIAALDTLEYLQKGGRISKAAAVVGSLASIKPVITLDEEGSVAIMQKCLGRSKALSFVIDRLKQQDLDPDFPVYSVYTSGTVNCSKLESVLAEKNMKLAGRQQIGSVIGTHVGPEVYGLVFVVKE